MKHLILGTAGHIDHGKTSLVKALTGIDTDRLKEEKARGITIELGFAHLELPHGSSCGIVDVPGHERFVRTMVAGVAGMDMVMLVIAADEGVMPQTREHMEICQLLGVKKGLVALTKSDMVEPDWLALAAEEVRDYLGGSFLEGAPVVPVSSRSGEGLDRIREELSRLAADVGEKRSDAPFRLPVDRVFTVTGFGTVVTGTLLSGEIAVGDEVELLPSGRSSRVRGVQVYGRKTDRARSGQRVAVNLQGIEQTEVQRGDAVVPPGIYRTTRTVDVALRHLQSAPRDLRHRSMFRLHSATYEVSAQAILLDRDMLPPGEESFVQLRLKHPVLLLPGDPFVLRSSSPQTTVAGGRILDPFPPRRRRRSEEAISLLQALTGEDEAEKVRLLISSALLSGMPFDDLVARTGLSAKKVEAALSPLLTSGMVVQGVREPRIYLSRDSFDALKRHLFAEAERYLAANPLKEGIGKEELKTRLPRRSDPRFFGPLTLALEKEKTIVVERELVRLSGRKGQAAEGKQADRLALIRTMLEKGGKEPPTIREIFEGARCTEKEALEQLNFLVREGLAVKVKSDVFYAPEPLADIRAALVAFLKEKGEITPPEFRDMTGLSRKFMIPLLGYFDGEKITIRVGDKRVLRKG